MARPLKYPTTKDLQAVIDKYFAECEGDPFAIPNKAGLRVRLKICRDTYSEWKKIARFSDAIKRAEERIEEAWVLRLMRAQPTGAIFYLKNAFKEDYKDRWEVSGDPDNPIVFMPIEIMQKHGLTK